MKLYPKLADGTVDITNTILLGHGQRHGTVQTWADTGAGGLNLEGKNAHHVIKAKITFVHYWKAYKEGHTGFMQRAVLADIPEGLYKGHGPIFGSLWNGGKTSPIGEIAAPCAMLETWGLGEPGVPKDFGFIRKGSNSPVLQDDISLDFMAVSTTFCDSIYSRYYLAALDYRSSQYVPIKDTRDMEDNNWILRRMSEALALFDASDVANRDPKYPDACMVVENLQSWWIPATTVVMPD